jgi:phage-related protein
MAGLKALEVSLGLVFLPAATKVLHVLDDFAVFLTKNKGEAIALATVIGGLLAGVAIKKLSDGLNTAKEGFQVVGGLIGKSIGLFTGEAAATGEATVAQEGLNLAFLASPIGLVIAGIALLVGVIVLIATKTRWFQDIWDASWGFMKKAFDNVFGFIKAHWPLILGILTGPVGMAVLVIRRYGGDIVSFMASLPGRIMGVLSNLGADMWNIGSNIIWGVIRGVESAVGSLFSYLGNIASNIGSVFSPSRVFYGFGRNIVEGLRLGISDHASLATGAVGDLANNVAKGFNPNMPNVRAAGQSGQQAPVTINVTVQGLVGDAGATGRQIAQSLNTYLRQTGQAQLVGA